jgi:hypothetical protein
VLKRGHAPGWVHEIKHDGYRLIARRDGVGEEPLKFPRHDPNACSARERRAQPVCLARGGSADV